MNTVNLFFVPVLRQSSHNITLCNCDLMKRHLWRFSCRPHRIRWFLSRAKELSVFAHSNRLPYMLYTPAFFKCLKSRSRGMYFSDRKFGCQTKQWYFHFSSPIAARIESILLPLSLSQILNLPLPIACPICYIPLPF